MKYISQLINFFVLIFKSLRSSRQVLSTKVDFLNASEILYIHNTEDTKTGFLYMHISFASHHKLSVLFHTREEYDAALKQLVINN
jgi:hypothetical protein